MNKELLKGLASEVRGKDDQLLKEISLRKEWKGDTCRFTIQNTGNESIQIKEVVLFKGDHFLTGETPFYGEGYNMLSQYGGTLSEPEDIGGYSDHHHYKLPHAKGFFTTYNILTLFLDNFKKVLLAFSSCRRFTGEFRFDKKEFEIVVNLEGIFISKGECIELEEFFIVEGQNRDDLLELLSQKIEKNHPKLYSAEVPTGWCSWYYYGPEFKEEDIYENLKAINNKIPEIK